MMKKYSMKHAFSQTTHSAGFTLLEVMIALVIFSIGLLGLAGLQATGVKDNYSAFSRTVAMQQASDMAERIRANLTAAGGGDYDAVSTSLIGKPSACTGNAAVNCDDATIALNDIYEWNRNNQRLLPSGRGTVSRNGSIFTVTVMWDEDRTGVTGEGCSGNASVDLKCYQLDFQL